MSGTGRFLYLSRADVEHVALPADEIVAAVELALTEKAAGRTHMPPKHWIAPSDRRFFSAMSSCLPAAAAAACKWQSGSPDNAALGLPYITGLLVLNDLATGLPIALMDSTWLTAQRTAAASAVAARALAVPDARTLAVLGCGVQGRINLATLRRVRPGIAAVQAFDIDAGALSRYASEMERQHGVAVRRCRSPEEAVRGADIVVTCGPITPDGPRAVTADWLKPGALVVTIDYDCYLAPGTLRAVDRVASDDVPQLLHHQEHGYFAGAPVAIAELGAIVAGTQPGRSRADERIVCCNLGIALEDVATARRIHAAALKAGAGTWLDL